MKKLHFQIEIAATREKVWHDMLGDAGYRDWTSAFIEGSYFEGSWDEGGKIRFLSPEGGGMVATIAVNRPFEFVSIKHIGVINAGVEDTESEAVHAWTPAFENYSFVATPGGTRVEVAMDCLPDWEAYMLDTWPQALARLKALCERA